MKHLIRKQVITLQLDAGQNAFPIQQQAKEYYYLHIAPVLEKLFDELSSENEIIHIEKLEIELGDLGWKNDRFTLDEAAIYRVLKQSLNKTLSDSANKDVSVTVVSYRTPEENTCLQWLYYMEKGVLPWEVQSVGDKWPEQILHQLAIDHELIQKTRKLILDSPSFLARLVREHHEVFLQHLAEVITAKQHPDLIEKITGWVVHRHNTDVVETHRTKKQLWGQVLKQFASGKMDADLQEILLTEQEKISQPPVSVDEQTMPEGLFCQYAGLVLLHPFFKHLFNHTGLLDDGMFKNNASREKGMVVLYFVATGKIKAKDYELVVPKMLCGMSLHEIINEESFFLTAAEQEEVLNMMHAAIEQWAIIHNTSPDGLREGFLVRDGKLLISDTGIELRIESNSIDVLLDRLPWNLSLIKLPWLSKLIRVEWR